jgi:two-component system chemotaxis sensor kinase CheA
MQDEDIIREFLVESHENLSRLDQELVELEKHPKDAELLASIFRTMHTIKGTCGFLAFSTLERISHQAETLLSQLRDGRRDLSPPLVSLILDTVDATRKVLGSIEASGEEGPERFEGLTERLRLAALLTPFAAEEKPVPVLTPPPAAEEKPVPVLKPPPAAEDKPMPVLKPPPTAAEEKPVPVLTPPPAAEEKPVPVLKPPPAAEDKPMPVLKPPPTAAEDKPMPVLTPPPTAAEDRPMPVSTPPLVEAPVAAVEHPDSAAAEHAEDKPRESELTKSSAVADSNIRVGVGLLDKLMDLVGELVLTRNQILQFNTEREDAALNVTSQRLNLITTELQEGVMKTRMQPIGMVWNKLPRVVRDIATSLGKQILLEMDGAETELDRTIIEAIKDPLVHLVRNSCDHGVETPEIRVRMGKPPQGTLSLRAYHEGGQVNIEIADDGAGIDVAQVKQKAIEKGLLGPEQAAKLTDREALGMVFLPGFSTAKKVTNVSGRGVGMDVVKSNIEKIGGIVDIFSRPGEGTTVKLKIPLTLVIIPGLVISSGGERFVIPQVSLLELIRLEGDSGEKRIERVHGTPVYRRRGTLLPIAYLNQVLGLESPGQTDVVSMVVLQAEDRQFGLVVDGINDTQEIVVKPLSKQLKGLTIYAGATIMGDGHVALILDVLGIGQRSGVMAESREQSRASVEKKTEAGMEQQRLLLFRAGSFERLAIPLSLVARLEEFPQSSIEHAGGSQVVQYRNRILPLIPLRDVLDSGTPAQGQPADPVQVIVFNDGDRSVGLMVDQILDVAEETVTVRQKSGRKGLLGSAVVGKRVADFLDLNQVIRVAAADWLQPAGASSAGKRILVAEASAFSRGLIRSGLDMAGYQVLEAANLDEALRSLERHPVDIVVTSLDLPPERQFRSAGGHAEPDGVAASSGPGVG